TLRFSDGLSVVTLNSEPALTLVSPLTGKSLPLWLRTTGGCAGAPPSRPSLAPTTMPPPGAPPPAPPAPGAPPARGAPAPGAGPRAAPPPGPPAPPAPGPAP